MTRVEFLWIILAVLQIIVGDIHPDDKDISSGNYHPQTAPSFDSTFRSSALMSKMPSESSLNTSQKEKIYYENPKCPRNTLCSELSSDCITCCFNYSCIYGDEIYVSCWVNNTIICQGNELGSKYFNRSMKCQYCYQADPADYDCTKSTSCRANGAIAQTYTSKCKVKDDVVCLGNREFFKKLKCNYTRGYSWSVALILSVALGGFGVDRFYLGMWQEGIGKLFSFGGLGVWTLVDVILIAAGYLGPADGSVFIY